MSVHLHCFTPRTVYDGAPSPTARLGVGEWVREMASWRSRFR